MGFWNWFFNRRTNDQVPDGATEGVAKEPGDTTSRSLENTGRADADMDTHVTHEEHETYGDSIPAFMRKSQTRPVQHGKSGRCAEDVPEASANDGLSSCSPNRQVKGALSFVLPDDRQAELMALCAQLDTHRSEVIRASLEMALPVFKSHPDLYDYFRQRSRQGW
jgi:hypothetical protein